MPRESRGRGWAIRASGVRRSGRVITCAGARARRRAARAGVGPCVVHDHRLSDPLRRVQPNGHRPRLRWERLVHGAGRGDVRGDRPRDACRRGHRVSSGTPAASPRTSPPARTATCGSRRRPEPDRPDHHVGHNHRVPGAHGEQRAGGDYGRPGRTAVVHRAEHPPHRPRHDRGDLSEDVQPAQQRPARGDHVGP